MFQDKEVNTSNSPIVLTYKPSPIPPEYGADYLKNALAGIYARAIARYQESQQEVKNNE